ncbi:hypothetical protein [Streptomyces sp. NPDC058308]|uniref:hypothetical protein n=1 Tax=Streptomyces sp. NPDC058308 TaxID=3346440 RepID=UPI0036E453C1
MRGRDRHRLLKERLHEYEKTPEIERQQNAALDTHYSEALREALATCCDPRADIYDIAECAFAHLFAGWRNWEEDPRRNLLQLVDEYSAQTLRKLPKKFDLEDWLTPKYPSIYKDVASPEQYATLQAVMELDGEARRLYEARRVYGWPVARTAETLAIRRNTIGPTTTRIERELGSRPGRDVPGVRVLFETYLAGGGD